MARFASTTDKVLVATGGVCILGSFACIMYGEWGTGVGLAGLISNFVESLGFAIFAIGLLLIGAWILLDARRAFVALSPAKRKEELKQTCLQIANVLLSVLVYGTIFVLCMGGVAALDNAHAGTLFVVVLTWALCIAGFVGFRKFRKKHPLKHDLASGFFLSLFMLFISILALTVSLSMGIPASVHDLISGPKTAHAALVDVSYYTPTGRYRAFTQSHVTLTFITPDDERIVLLVPENDSDSAAKINDLGNYVQLTYYPETQIYCDATRWDNGQVVLGDEVQRWLIADGDPDN